jgi:hypothetical protein
MVQQETDLQVMSCTEKIYLDQRMKIKDLYKWEKLMRHKKVNVKQVIQTVLTLLQQIIYLDQRSDQQPVQMGNRGRRFHQKTDTKR